MSVPSHAPRRRRTASGETVLRVRDLHVTFPSEAGPVRAAGELKGIFRGGWQMDYPSIENFLTPIYAKGAASNDAKYDNAAFQAALTAAAAATDPAAANAKYQEAEAMLAETYPTLPLWYSATPFAHSTKVTDVELNAFGAINLTGIKLK